MTRCHLVNYSTKTICMHSRMRMDACADCRRGLVWARRRRLGSRAEATDAGAEPARLKRTAGQVIPAGRAGDPGASDDQDKPRSRARRWTVLTAGQAGRSTTRSVPHWAVRVPHEAAARSAPSVLSSRQSWRTKSTTELRAEKPVLTSAIAAPISYLVSDFGGLGRSCSA